MLSFVRSEQNGIFGIKQYIGESANTESKASVTEWLGNRYVTLFYEDGGSIPTRSRSLNHYIESVVDITRIRTMIMTLQSVR